MQGTEREQTGLRISRPSPTEREYQGALILKQPLIYAAHLGKKCFVLCYVLFYEYIAHTGMSIYFIISGECVWVESF